MTSDRPLLVIAQEQIKLWEMLEQADGELESLEPLFDALVKDMEQKVDSYKKLDSTLKCEISRIKGEAKKLMDSARQLERIEQGLFSRIKQAMRVQGVTELVGNTYRYKLFERQGALTIDETELPSEFKKQTIFIEPDKEKIKAALDAGVDVPGCYYEPSLVLRDFVRKGIES